MRKILKLKRGKFDDIIKEILRGKQMTRIEIVTKCEEYGIPRATAYRRINQFIKYNEFEKEEYIRLARRYEEADPKQVRNYFEALLNSRSIGVLESRLETLGLL